MHKKTNVEIDTTGKTTIDSLIGLSIELAKIDVVGLNIKTAYWISKNARLLAPFTSAFEALRTEITGTIAFKQYHSKLQEAKDDQDAIAKINEEYKQVVEDANEEIITHVSQLVDIPKWVKISIDDLQGIEGSLIPRLIDLIE